MSIQITNDPINQFLDNLPRYALELRRQDQQRDQFNRQMELREQAAKNQQTLFDLTRNKQKYQDEVFRNQLQTTSDYRNAIRGYEKHQKKYQDLVEQYKKSQRSGFLGIGKPTSYDEFLSRRASGPLNEVSARYKQALLDYKSQKDLSKIRPKEILPPKGVEIDKSLMDFANEQILPTRAQDINRLFNIFGGNQMGTVSAPFAIQQLEIEGQR
tara:strand:- start:652 stop:1290 length:639 start_codon:yes stop_codon:yes gene_type:complete